MKILILGHKGMLGSDLFLRLMPHHEIEGRDIDECDITSPEACRDVVAETAPELLINAAAFTNVDACEIEEEQCFAVNALGVRNLALACRETGIVLVHFSTDYVFDGTKGSPYREDDPTGPINVYGRSKLEGEHYLRESGTPYLLVRTAWLYGNRGKNFVKAILERARNHGRLEVVDDQIGSPTYSGDLAAAVRVLVEGGHRGVFHVTGRGTCSWYEFARKILQCAGLEDVAIAPIGSNRLQRPARRPAYSVLSNRKFIETTGRAMRYWQIALQDYLEHGEKHP